MAAGRLSTPDSEAPAADEWSRWWLTGRFDAATPARTQQRRDLETVRDHLLDLLRLRPYDDGLDVGCGDGTIGFGLLDRLESGNVTFSDISAGLVEHCRREAAARGLSARCRFQVADAVTLAGVPDRSVDVLTSRSVLC